jgi:hypothetical protein
MNKICLLLLVLAVAVVSFAEEPRVFSLATAGDVDVELAGRVRTYMEDQAGVAVRMVAPVVLQPGQSLETIGLAAAQALKASEVGIVVLARPDSEQPQGVCLPHEHFGVLNMARLGEDVNEDQLVRRAGQDGLRVMSMLLGMSPCPFPLCVLTGFEKTEDLDRMSGNYCPPCQDRFTRLARDAKIQETGQTAEALAPAVEAVAEVAGPAVD